MFHSRTLNNKINRLHERCLCIIYNDNTSSFTDLLEKENSVSVHHRNVQVLATELYKFVNGLSRKLVSDKMTVCITLETGPLSILGHFAQSSMAQNHSPTWDRKFGNLCQVI